MKYSEKLKSPKWQKKRLEILQRDNWQCVHCSDDKHQLHVHHKKYIRGREPWEYDNSNFIALCEKCHQYVHSNIEKLEPKVVRVKISVKNLLNLNYENYLGQEPDFVPAIIQWNYNFLLKIKKEGMSYFNKRFSNNVTKKDMVLYLTDQLNKECIKYNVKLTNGGSVIYG